jgi:glycosyltransferase 2 family protein
MISDGQRTVGSFSGWLRRGIWSIAGTLLAALLIWLVVRAADWRSVAVAMGRANIWVLSCAWVFIGGASWLLRAARWHLLLTAEKPLRFWPVFWANSAGNLGNVLLPARAGEFIRAAMIGAGFGLPQRFVLATAACERILDLLVFATMAEVAVSFGSGIPTPILDGINIALLIAVAGVSILILIARSEKLLHFFVSRVLRQPDAADGVLRHLEPVLAGVRSIHSSKRLFGFLALSAIIWVLDVSGAKLVAYAMGFALPFPVAFVLTAGLVFINLIPATPGQLGVYQWVVIHVLAISHIEYNQALAYSLVLQASGYLTLALLGVPGLLTYRRSRQQTDKPGQRGPAEINNPAEWARNPQ